MLGAIDDRLHLRHHLIVRDARFLRCHRPLDLGPEPRVVRRGVFAGRELGLDWGEIGHDWIVGDRGGARQGNLLGDGLVQPSACEAKRQVEITTRHGLGCEASRARAEWPVRMNAVLRNAVGL